MTNKEITNEDIMREIKNLRSEIDTIRRMIYETNMDFFDTMQIANFDNRYPFEIVPLTNRELILYAMQMHPIVDPKTRRERLVTTSELVKEGFSHDDLLYGFEINQDEHDEGNIDKNEDFDEEL